MKRAERVQDNKNQVLLLNLGWLSSHIIPCCFFKFEKIILQCYDILITKFALTVL